MGMQDHQDVENRINKKELEQIVGGRSISGTVISAFNSAFKTLYGFGQDFGGSIRRIIKRKLCSL